MATDRLLDFPVVDAHFHLWDRAANPYPWLAEDSPRPALGDHRPLMRSFGLSDHRREIGRFLDVAGGIHVEAGCADPVAETRWIADAASSAGMPLAHVARVDLTDEQAPKRIAELSDEPIVRGVRMRLNADPRIAGRAGIADEPLFRCNFRAVADSALVFELSIFPSQYEEGGRLARDFPGTWFILNHLGWPRIAEGLDDFDTWRRAMGHLARHPNIAVKLSMLWPIDRGWRRNIVEPFIAETVDLFGTDRVLFGSNYPIEAVIGETEHQLSTVIDCLRDLTKPELEAVFRLNAARIFDLSLS